VSSARSPLIGALLERLDSHEEQAFLHMLERLFLHEVGQTGPMRRADGRRRTDIVLAKDQVTPPKDEIS
jgi:hypothetical protein